MHRKKNIEHVLEAAERAVMDIRVNLSSCVPATPHETSGARLEITNKGPVVDDPLFYNITYQEMVEPPSTFRFHAQWRRENPTLKGVRYTILDAEGSGHYVGCHLNMQNREWWLRGPLKEIKFPRGFGLGMMEGWELIYRDGELEPSVRGTGTEDYFNGAWYFLSKGGRFAAPYHGCLVRDVLRGRVAAYRFDLSAPVSFSRSLKVEIAHGFYNELECDYSSTAYWYQAVPHRPFDELPPVHLRKPHPPIRNLAQSALILGPPVAALLALLWGLGRRRKA